MIKKSKLAVTVVLIILLLALFLVFVSFRTPNKEENQYILKYKDEMVGLYLNDKLIEEFEGISVMNLPKTDQGKLFEGISFESYEEAIKAIEDYDG